MTEYIDKQSVYKEACAGCACHGDEIGSCFSSDPCERLCFAFASANAVDVAPVVHCKDCKHFDRAKFNRKGFKICPASGMNITPEDYCSYGERRET